MFQLKYVNYRECVSSCPEGTYPSDDNRCLNCHETCSICTGPQKNHCLACQPEKLYIAHLGLCGTSCPVGYYAGK